MDKIKEIKNLKSLLDQGAITNEEYLILKKNLISNNIGNISPNNMIGKESQKKSPKEKRFTQNKGTHVLIIIVFIVGFLILMILTWSTPMKKLAIENSWQILNPDNSEILKEGECIQFTESSIESTSGALRYKINWTDNSSFNLIDDNNNSNYKVKLRKISDGTTIQITFLYETEHSPTNDEEWSILQKNNRIMVLKMGEKSSNDSNILSPYIRRQDKEKQAAKELFVNYIALAETSKLVFGEGQVFGKLTKVEFLFTSKKSGIVINIPDGKMWTPLFFEFRDLGTENYFEVTVPKILTEQHQGRGSGRNYYNDHIYDDLATHTWWIKDNSNYFTNKKNFVSIKLAKQNCKALSGKNAIYVSSYNQKVRYILYFLEEPI